jgi:hypothetical protein
VAWVFSNPFAIRTRIDLSIVAGHDVAVETVIPTG